MPETNYIFTRLIRNSFHIRTILTPILFFFFTKGYRHLERSDVRYSRVGPDDMSDSEHGPEVVHHDDDALLLKEESEKEEVSHYLLFSLLYLLSFHTISGLLLVL